MLLAMMELPLLQNGSRQNAPNGSDTPTMKPYALPRHLREEMSHDQLFDPKEDELWSIFGLGEQKNRDTGQKRESFVLPGADSKKCKVGFANSSYCN